MDVQLQCVGEPIQLREALPPDSDQLELELDDVRLEARLPWGGVSPRELTGAFKRFSLGAPPAGGLR